MTIKNNQSCGMCIACTTADTLHNAQSVALGGVFNGENNYFQIAAIKLKYKLPVDFSELFTTNVGRNYIL